MSNTDNPKRLARRSVLRGIEVGAIGIAAAALIGCSGQSDQAAEPSPQGAKTTGTETLDLVAPVANGKPREGGVYTTALTSTYVQHDLGTAGAANVWHVISEKGIEPNPRTGELVPHVLTSWEVADKNGLELVFKVKPGIKIHDVSPWNGRQFTAEDVAWNLERIGGLYAERLKIPLPAFQRASMVANITKAQAVDQLTVKVTLSKPNSSFFNGLSDTRVHFAPKEMDDIGWGDPMKFGGIGAYQMDEFVKDQRQNYNKFSGYSAFRPNEPHFDAFRQAVVPDSAATLAAYISGQIGRLDVRVASDLDTALKAKPDALHYQWISNSWNHFRPNVSAGPFQDYRVRKAIFLATDYAAINDGYYGAGWGYQAALTPAYPEAWRPGKVKTLPGYDPATKEADRAEALKLLAAAGYPNGKGIEFGIKFTGGGDSVHQENATRFVPQMQAAFREMKPSLVPLSSSAIFNKAQTDGAFDMVAYVIGASPDAVIEVASQYYTDGSRNYGRFTNASLDSLVDKAAAELSMASRAKLLEEFQTRFISEWMPNFVLGAVPNHVLMPGNIGGFDTIVGTANNGLYAGLSKVCRLYYVDK